MSTESMQQKIEFNRVYRRIEIAEQSRAGRESEVSPSIEIVGNTTVSVYASNLPRFFNSERYKSPIENSEITTKMTLTDQGLEPGFHDACICTHWIAFVADDPSDPPCIYDCGLIDWEREYRIDNPC